MSDEKKAEVGCLKCFALGELRIIDQRKNDEAQEELRGAYAELHRARAEVERLRGALEVAARALSNVHPNYTVDAEMHEALNTVRAALAGKVTP